jgi:hypothetical protein
VALDRATELSRALAGLTAVEVMRRKRAENYAPEKGEAHVDDEGQFQPGWLSNDVLTEMFAKNKYNPEQKRIIREMNKLIRKGAGDRVVMINFPATTRNKAGKVVYKPQGATLRDTVPVAVTISKDGNLLFGLMSVTKLHENIQKRSQDRRGKKLYGGNVDLILRDTQAMMDYHKQGLDSIEFFKQKYGAVEADERKKFINTMFGLLNQKEQAVLNPMLLEDGIKSKDNVYRTYRADRVSKAVPMAPEEYAAMPFSYEAVSQVRMPEAQRAMPEGEQGGDVTLTRLREIRDGLDENLTEREAIDELDFIINDAPSGYFPQDILNKVDQAKRDLEEEFTTWAGRGDSEASTESAISSVMSFLDSKESRGEAAPTRFMPEKLDSDYMKAVESGDVETQQRMVDEVAKQAGYRQGVLWHGSRGKKFTVFDETKGDRLPWMEGHVGHYFSPDKNIASAMGSNVLSAYLKMDNPLILDAGDYSYSAITPARKKEIQKQGYDSVIGTPQTNAGKQEFIVFDSNQIKSADPITRDDSGNVIPLSKRFDVGSRDIRYMPEGEAKEANLKLLQTKETLKDWAFGQANWKDWYSEHQETLDDFFGDQAELFQEILAVTSQAASVKANVGLALKAFGQLMRNEEFDGKLRGEEKSGYLPAVIKNLNAIKNKTQVGGRKISNYKSANEGDSSKVVVDRHIARMLFGVDTPTAKQYAKAESVLSDVAKELGWEPAQVQAALWAQSIVMSGKEPVSYGAYLKSLEAKKLTKKELISGLKGNQITRRIGQLSGSGYGSNELSKARGRYSPASENAPKGKKGLGASTPKPKRSTAKGDASAIANAAKLK